LLVFSEGVWVVERIIYAVESQRHVREQLSEYRFERDIDWNVRASAFVVACPPRLLVFPPFEQ
jgi:hypothetical protein